MRLSTVLTALGGACLLLAAGLSVSPLRFAFASARAQATVVSVEGRNAVCERASHARRDDSLKKQERRQYACTRYRAELRFEAEGHEVRSRVSAGDAPGRDQPPSQADRRVGETLAVAYRRGHPDEAYPAEAAGTLQRWGGPLIALMLGACLIWIGHRRR